MSTKTKQKRTKAEDKPEAPFQLPPGVLPGKEAILAGHVEQIPLDKIDIINKADRANMSDAELKIAELAQSIATAGLQQPIHVIPHNGSRYALVFGERRVRACRLLKHERISAIVVQQSGGKATDIAASEARAVENIQRIDPSPIGEAVAIADLFDIKLVERIEQWKDDQPDGRIPSKRATIWPTVPQMAWLRQSAIERTAERVGKPIAWVRDRMFLAGFSGKARELVSSGLLPLTHAREIAKVADPRRRDELAMDFAIGHPGSGNYYANGEGRPGDIEDLREEVAKSMWSLAQVPWKADQPFDGKPACAECPHNSLNQPGLFEGKALFADDPKQANKFGRFGAPDERAVPKSGICLKPECYKEKSAAASRALASTVTKVINKHEAAAARKESGSGKMLGVSEISNVAPSFLSPFAVKERVEARIEARKPKKGAAKTGAQPKRKPGDYGTPEYVARREAESAFFNQSHDWIDKKATPAMSGYLAKVPGRWAMWSLVQRTKAYEKAVSYNAKPRDIDSPELLKAIRLIEKPSLDNMVEVEKLCGTRYGLFGECQDDAAPNKVIYKLLTVLGLGVEAPPDKEEMIKAALAKLREPDDPKPNAKGGKKPAAKKADADDEEGDEDE